MLEKKISALKNMNNEELVREYLGKSGQYEEAIKAEILSRMN